ncbi:4-aminobutyrate--2-oxoglutarate transaminase [Ureibacillus aquaedulcis]|uniref:(S)-3-amino-2-methylpropionate transaminase n=1 Tax=Ureibacillus aquaedulcis TaxID=3058421 RepID=A0ABT8GNR1_9BACL|nr:4-aminobutyrate--2-oxoglutarate transaminase [Ureibacillus sp. BA0131]MDN4493058.1 4-aminobutyrate--2-oxoglutarate transaminase [Ureibacillus sp. BA0131]
MQQFAKGIIKMIKENIAVEIVNKRKEFVVQGVSNGCLAVAREAKGSTIIDTEGNAWIDFASAIGTLNVGHSHPKVVAAVQAQVEKFLHPGFNVIMYDSYIKLAEKLVEITPGTHDKQVILLNSGAEAVENAVKIARKYTKKQGIVAFTNGYHGRTNLTMGMTSKVKPYKFEFGPFAPEIYKAPFPYVYRKPEGLTDEQYVDFIIEQFHDFFVSTIAPEMVACVVMEPVQGEGGFIVPPKKFVQAVANFCKENNIVLIADEIQTGFARTGSLFAIEQFDVVPDLMTVSKSLAAGLPLSGVVGRKEIMEVSTPGELGGTYAGSPVACEAALAVIDIIEEENLCAASEAIGAKLEAHLETYKAKYSFIGDIRRLGAMVAVELVGDNKVPNKEAATAIAQYANANGLLLLTAGIKGNVIRFLTPLVITDEELAQGLAILDDAFANYGGK